MVELDAPSKPQLDIDQQFNDLTANLMFAQQEEENNDRITVMLHLPYLKDYGMPEIIYPVYGCTFPVAIGDQVLCPPTPRGDGSWNVGIVTALNGGDYKGPVKYVRKVAATSDNSQDT
jgi:hypothetical protein